MTENERNNLQETITHILEDMKKEEGTAFSLDKGNLVHIAPANGRFCGAKRPRCGASGHSFLH